MDELFPIPVYAAMLAATLAGQFVGIGLDALLFAGRAVWAPLACSVLLEAVVGAYHGAARLGHPLTPRDRARISVTYSLGLVAVSMPMAAWLSISNRLPALGSGGPASRTAAWAALGLAALLGATALRYVLMGFFGRRSP